MTPPAEAGRDHGFWFGKRVLITGGDGFVAAHLADALMRRHANVVVVVRHLRPTTTMRLLGITESAPDIEYSDLTSFVTVQKLCNRHQIDTVFHLAASAVVSDASRAPISTFENNIIPTLNILETARINGIRRVLIASSDKSYGDHADVDDPERIPYRENHALRGLDVYSASKVCADMISQTYAFQFKLPVIVVRSANIYGPGDLNFTRLIPKTILRLLLDLPPIINEGNARVLREYIFIDDVVAAYLFLAEHVEAHYRAPRPQRGRATYGWDAYNIGSYAGPPGAGPEGYANVRSVVQVIEQIRTKLGRPDLEPVVVPKAANVIEIPDQYLDSSKLMGLGFRTGIGFDEGLERAVEWYRQRAAYLTRLGHRQLVGE